MRIASMTSETFAAMGLLATIQATCGILASAILCCLIRLQ